MSRVNLSGYVGRDYVQSKCALLHAVYSRVRVRFSVGWLSCYAHVFVLL